MGIITLNKVDALWWLGRYTERVFTTLRTFLPFYDTCLDHDAERFRVFSDALDLNADVSDLASFLEDFLYDKHNANSVCAAMNAAFDNAILLRPEVGTRTLGYIELAINHLRDSREAAERISALRSACDALLAFWGSLEDGGSSSEVKAFVMAGKYVERLDLYSRFKRPEADFHAPVVRLAFNMQILPERARALLSPAIAGAADALKLRGYSEELVERVHAIAPVPCLDEDGNVMSATTAVDA